MPSFSQDFVETEYAKHGVKLVVVPYWIKPDVIETFVRKAVS